MISIIKQWKSKTIEKINEFSPPNNSFDVSLESAHQKWILTTK